MRCFVFMLQLYYTLSNTQAVFCVCLQDWGMGTDPSSLNMELHDPSPAELQSLQDVFSTNVLRELKYLDENEQCDRENLQRRLRIIFECIKGAGQFLPPLESQSFEL